MKNVLDVF